MNNDLVAITFDSEQDALKARGALEIMRNSQFLSVTSAVLVTRDRIGKVVVQHQRQVPANSTDPCSQVPVLLAETMFGTYTEENAQQQIDAGLDEMFVKMVRAALIPQSSMILFYVGQDCLVDTQKLLDALNQFEGTVHHTTVPVQVEGVILKQSQKEAK